MKKTRTTEENVKYWKSHIEEHRKSRVSQKEYCRQQEISYWSFNHWKKQIRTKSSKLQEIPANIVQSLTSRDKEIELILNDRLRISIPERFSEDTLKNILNILGVSI